MKGVSKSQNFSFPIERKVCKAQRRGSRSGGAGGRERGRGHGQGGRQLSLGAKPPGGGFLRRLAVFLGSPARPWGGGRGGATASLRNPCGAYSGLTGGPRVSGPRPGPFACFQMRLDAGSVTGDSAGLSGGPKHHHMCAHEGSRQRFADRSGAGDGPQRQAGGRRQEHLSSRHWKGGGACIAPRGP